MVVTSGSARLCFGGPPEEGNIGRLELEVKQGDVMIVPAGVSHAMLENRGGFEMLGVYPIGADDWDFCVGKEEEKGEAWERIKGLAWFEKDPVYGDKGQYWKSSRKRASQKLEDKYGSPMVIIYQLPSSSLCLGLNDFRSAFNPEAN